MIQHYFFISDTHLGLKTAGIDRREEILKIFKFVIDKAVEKKLTGDRVRLVLGGDIFDDDNPSEDLITCLLVVLNWIEAAEINCDVLVGNHEAVANPERLSCLSFIKALEEKYQFIRLREKIELVQYDGLYVTFLPHITKATLATLKTEYKSTQEYIDTVGKKIMTKVGKGVHVAFSHLNVKQSRSGSEANLLKRSEAFLPLAFVNTPPGCRIPVIVNGHIHEAQQVDNVFIAGSPLFCSFGETQDKTFTMISIDPDLKEFEENVIGNSSLEVIRTPTPFTPFLQAEVDMIGNQEEFLKQPVVSALVDKAGNYLNDGHSVIMKFQVTINAENNTYDWNLLRKQLEISSTALRVQKTTLKILPIEPKVIQHRITRNEKQVSTLDPQSAVKVFLKKNLKADEVRMKRIYQKSKQYLGAEQ